MPSSKPAYNAPTTFAEVVGTEISEEDILKEDLLHGLQKKLREFFCGSDRVKKRYHKLFCEDHAAFGLLEKKFADDVIVAARFAFEYKEHLSLSLSFAEIIAEQKALSTKLQAAINKLEKYPNRSRDSNSLAELAVNLRQLSPDLDRHLGYLADPRGCAAALDSFIAKKIDRQRCIVEIKALLYCMNSKTAKRGVGSVPSKPRNSANHLVAVELAAWVCPVLEHYGMTVSAYASESGACSDAMKVLSLIGKSMVPVMAPNGARGTNVLLSSFLPLSPRAWADAISEARDTAQKVG